MNAKTQPFGMNIIGQRLKPFAIRRRGKLFQTGGQTPVFIHRQLGTALVDMPLRIGFIPLNIDGQNIVTRRQKIFLHSIGLLLDLLLGNCGPENIPAVPSQMLNCSHRTQYGKHPPHPLSKIQKNSAAHNDLCPVFTLHLSKWISICTTPMEYFTIILNSATQGDPSSTE
jgi:hypothetical protein